jgi:hypothetical protein
VVGDGVDIGPRVVALNTQLPRCLGRVPAAARSGDMFVPVTHPTVRSVRWTRSSVAVAIGDGRACIGRALSRPRGPVLVVLRLLLAWRVERVPLSGSVQQHWLGSRQLAAAWQDGPSDCGKKR